MTEVPKRYENFLREPFHRVADMRHYGIGMMIMMAVLASVVTLVGRSAPSSDALSEVESAVLVDLPPYEAASQPESDADVGPPQQAAQVAAARPAPDQIDPPRPVKAPEPEDMPVPHEVPPVIKPDPPAVLERKEKATRLKPVALPSTTPQKERAPPGSDAPTRQAINQSDGGDMHPSAHAITVWQRALMKRLETAKHLFSRDVRTAGIVKVAFKIDGSGAILGERISSSSGDTHLDQAALALVMRAAPFPTAPRGATSQDLSFVVPVRFKK